MIDPTVRAATDADVDQLRHLEHEARAAVFGQRGGVRWLAEHPPIAGQWRERLRDDHVVVGHIGDVVVSVMVAGVADDGVLRVELVWVTPEARELGFGDEMLAWVIERGRADGAIGIEGEALPGDRHTKNLWERAGVVARLIVTYREF